MNKLKFSMVAVLSATMLTACSLPDSLTGLVPGMSNNTSEAPASTEETAKKPEFDYGGYDTKPKKILKDTDAEITRSVESFVLGEYVPLPYEIDGIFTESRGAYTVFSAKSLAIHLSSNFVKKLEEYRPLYGYLVAAGSKTEKIQDPSFGINHAVIRFEDPDTARQAAAALHTEATTVGSVFLESDPPAPRTQVEIPGLPNTLASSSFNEYDSTTSYMAFTPHEEYVFYTWASAPQSEEARNGEFVKKAYELQIPLLEQFPSVKTSAGFGKTEEFPSMDPGGMVIYAVQPRPEDDKKNVPGSFGPRGIAGRFNNSKFIHDTLVQSGSLHNGKVESYVFRADNDFGARAIFNAFVSDNLQSGSVEYDEPQGIPDTQCTVEESNSGPQYSCYVINGRYVGYVSESADTTKEKQEEAKKKTSQKLAAQYEILKQADQNAGKPEQ